MPVIYKDLGFKNFSQTWEMQKRAQSEIINGSKDEMLFTVEHCHVYTLGKTGNRNHLLISNEEMKEKGISYFEIDRGGDITYHGPGQLVAYPILNLNNYLKDLHWYLRKLEECVILTLKELGIKGYRKEEYTGVWVEEEKICAIGVKVSRWITMHGLAFNINTDLDFFDKIIPCGIFHKGVTSVEKITGKKADFEVIKQIFVKNFFSVFS